MPPLSDRAPGEPQINGIRLEQNRVWTSLEKNSNNEHTKLQICDVVRCDVEHADPVHTSMLSRDMY